MSESDRKSLDQALASVPPSRRGFLKSLMAAERRSERSLKALQQQRSGQQQRTGKPAR